MKEVFEILNPPYNFRSKATHFKREDMKTTQYGIQSVRYLGPKIWDMVPNNVKNCSSLNNKPNECSCRLCKKYIAQVGFIWFTSTFCNISEEKILLFYIHFLLRKFRLVSWCFFVFIFVCCLSRCFGWFPQGSRRWCIFLGISSLRNWVEILYFVQWLSLFFVFYQFVYLLLLLLLLLLLS